MTPGATLTESGTAVSLRGEDDDLGGAAHVIRVLQLHRVINVTRPRTKPDRHLLADNVLLLDCREPLEASVSNPSKHLNPRV